MAKQQTIENKIGTGKIESTTSKNLLELNIGETGYVSWTFIRSKSQKFLPGKKYYIADYTSVSNTKTSDATVAITRTAKNIFTFSQVYLEQYNFYELQNILESDCIELTVVNESKQTATGITKKLRKLFQPKPPRNREQKTSISIATSKIAVPPPPPVRTESFYATSRYLQIFNEHFGFNLSERHIKPFEGELSEMPNNSFSFITPWTLFLDENGQYYFINSRNTYPIPGGTLVLPVLRYKDKYYFDVSSVPERFTNDIKKHTGALHMDATPVPLDHIIFDEQTNYSRNLSHLPDRFAKTQPEDNTHDKLKAQAAENKQKQLRRFEQLLGVKLINVPSSAGSISGMPDNSIGWATPWSICLDKAGNYYLKKNSLVEDIIVGKAVMPVLKYNGELYFDIGILPTTLRKYIKRDSEVEVNNWPKHYTLIKPGNRIME